MSQSAVGTIFNVQRFSLHDGPGMRDRADTPLLGNGLPQASIAVNAPQN